MTQYSIQIQIYIFMHSTENSSDGVNQVTILNEEGEPVTNHDENEVIASGSRKRRPTSKIREILQGETPAKKNGKQSSIHNMFAPLQSSRHSAVSNQRNEVEIDVSDVDCIRLNTNKYNDDRQATNERHEELFQYIQRVDEKLDAILKHFNVPFTPSPQVVSLDGKSSTTRFAATTLASLSSITSSNSRSSPSAASTSARSRSSNALPLAHNFFTNTPEIHTICSDKQDSQQEFTQYVISDELLEATYLRSRNRGNFSKNLVYAAFPLEERLGRNCYGRRGGSISGPKEPLEAAKLDAVREAVFRKFPAPALEEEGIWKKECVIAIDTALRSEMRQRFLSVKVDL